MGKMIDYVCMSSYIEDVVINYGQGTDESYAKFMIKRL